MNQTIEALIDILPSLKERGFLLRLGRDGLSRFGGFLLL